MRTGDAMIIVTVCANQRVCQPKKKYLTCLMQHGARRPKSCALPENARLWPLGQHNTLESTGTPSSCSFQYKLKLDPLKENPDKCILVVLFLAAPQNIADDRVDRSEDHTKRIPTFHPPGPLTCFAILPRQTTR